MVSVHNNFPLHIPVYLNVGNQISFKAQNLTIFLILNQFNFQIAWIEADAAAALIVNLRNRYELRKLHFVRNLPECTGVRIFIFADRRI